MEKTTKIYWSGLWKSEPEPRPLDSGDRGLRNHVRRVLCDFFRLQLGQSRPGRLIEVGCARSIWLPFFAKELGWKVAGLDYSDIGCDQTRAILSRAGVEADVLHADLFAPPNSARGTYDAVISLGVVEHFEVTQKALRACADLAAPGGIVLTTIPNTTGLTGFFQRWFNREVYDMHMHLTAAELGRAHELAGLDVQSSGYLMFTNFGILVTAENGPVRKFLRRLLLSISVIFWLFERVGLRLPPNRFTSPYVYCVARKK